MMTRRFFAFMFLVLFFCIPVIAKENPNIKTKDVDIPKELKEDILDTPTAGLLPYGQYHLDFRVYNSDKSQGASVLTKLAFGFNPFNLGLYLDVEKLIGRDQMALRKPNVFFKVKVLSGDKVMPALALGFDQQGYGSFINDKYTQREKGLFAVMTKELFFEKMDFNIGFNIYDFDKYEVFGFLGFVYEVSDAIFVFAEYDNIRIMPDTRLNLGVRYSFTPEFSLQIFGKNLFEDNNGIERMIKLSYQGVF